jgi:hypothetical protein
MNKNVLGFCVPIVEVEEKAAGPPKDSLLFRHTALPESLCNCSEDPKHQPISTANAKSVLPEQLIVTQLVNKFLLMEP